METKTKRVSRSLGHFLPKTTLKLNLLGSKPKSSSNVSSPPKSPITPSSSKTREKELKKPSSSSNVSSPPKSPITPRANKSREEELKTVFGHFDVNNDGKISALELRSYFASLGEYMSHETAQGFIDDLDTDGDSLIDFGDFLRLMTKEGDKGGDRGGGCDDDDIKAAFQIYELNGTGRITPRSLQRVMSQLGDQRSYDECVAMINEFDVDGNGELDFNEFHQMMA